jgi:hypothetical protein
VEGRPTLDEISYKIVEIKSRKIPENNVPKIVQTPQNPVKFRGKKLGAKTETETLADSDR